ncbi:hypothetical protein PVAP13_1NG418438 [Panicum virgatum]|uniref:Uncharacterized protein n=1 Tax=Panicum virgatum TaxID=38727 RepID=A0A8T0X3F1_PANVG|nr:hypothetical protein PVAP13_1NG418438 [Panicum virgatum]KAG2653976.1 hypothetical protein PVAP13_1NG418438 [Panicum virgatum]
MTCRPLSMLAANALACGIARMRSFVRAACAAAACETSTGRQVLRFGYTMASSSHAGSQMASSSWPVRLLCMVHIGSSQTSWWLIRFGGSCIFVVQDSDD